MGLSSSLIAFVLSHLLMFHLTLGQNKSQPNCPESFECGSLGVISFPFFNLAEPNCGLCEVDCDAKPSPKINPWPGSEWYFYTVGKPHDNIIRIRSEKLENRSCDIFRNPSNFPNPASISFTTNSPKITLFKCYLSSGEDYLHVHFAGYEKFTHCAQEDRFLVYYQYTNETNTTTLPTPPHKGCLTIQLPVKPFDPHLDANDLFGLLASEFDLEWHISDDCNDCRRNGGQCLTGGDHRFRCWKLDTQEKSNLRVILVTVVSAGGVAIIMLVYYCLRRKCSTSKSEADKYQNVGILLKNHGSLAPKRYRYSDVKKMTSSFKIKLGEGVYGSVYKGKLGDGSLVAVKNLNDVKGNGEEFINEVTSISRTSHVNIVKLLGFCFERNKRALIYEFMHNGSLEKFIYEEKSLMARQLGWQTLYKIAVGIARGLEYLHCRCNARILHFDIKPHNILLDEKFCPKISDFGLSKLSTGTKSIVSTLDVRGTIGYIAPEVICRNIGRVSNKSDVYSYGMMILEMVGGRKNVDVGVDHTSEIYYPHWIYKQLELKQDIGFDEIFEEEENEKAIQMSIVSLWCIQTDPLTRPSMTKVVEMLEGNLESLQIPPKPYLYSPSQSPIESSSVLLVT